jgi:predicted permease
MNGNDVRKPWWQSETFWILVFLSIGLLIAVPATFAIGRALGFPTFVIGAAEVTMLIFVAMPFLTGTVEHAHLLTPQRAIALFGVIPIVGAVVAVVMSFLGISTRVALYVFGGVMVLSNLVYWWRFDKGVPPSARSNGSEASRREDL